MADASIAQLLLSGTVGAILAAGLNHYVRRYEAKRDRNALEAKSAHIYLAKISRFLAGCEVLITFGKTFGRFVYPAVEDLRKGSKFKDKFDASHVIAHEIYKGIKEKDLGSLDYAQLRGQLQLFHEHIDEYMDFKLSQDQISRLPEKVLIHYVAFEEQSIAFKYSFRQLASFIDGKADYGVELVHALWMAAKLLYETGDHLRTVLKVHGGISEEEFNATMTHARNYVTRISGGTFEAKEKLRFAAEAMTERDKREKATAKT